MGALMRGRKQVCRWKSRGEGRPRMDTDGHRFLQEGTERTERRKDFETGEPRVGPPGTERRSNLGLEAGIPLGFCRLKRVGWRPESVWDSAAGFQEEEGRKNRSSPCKRQRFGYVVAMSYRTLEVELDHGRVQPCGAETLPARAHALLTILADDSTKPVAAAARTLGQALRELRAVGRGDFTDLSTNKAHLDDFGK